MEIRPISVEETYPVRAAVLRPGRPKEELFFPGDDNPDVIHLGICDQDELVGIATIFPEPMEGRVESAWRLRGMAVLPEQQGTGLGRVLLDACLAKAREAGAALFWCNARESAVPFYERHGFSISGEGFEIPRIGRHFKMLKLL